MRAYQNNNSDVVALPRGRTYMKTASLLPGVAAFVALAAVPGWSAPVPVDTISPDNGITDLFSATFDGALTSCTPSDPAWCSFFNGKPGSSRNIVITPDPTTVINGVPNGFGTAPAAGSFLDVAVNGARDEVTLSGGTIAVPPISLVIQGGTPNATTVNTVGAGVVFNSAPQTAALDVDGRAEFLVNLAPTIAADFSTFTAVVTSCSGPLCSIIPVLTLDMVRYRLVIDFDPTYTTFTIDYIGQTGNNSILSLTINSADRIAVTDSAAPAFDESIPFGDVSTGSSADRTVSISNVGTSALLLGTLVAPLPPFSLVNDTCSGQSLAALANCTVDVRLQPTAVGAVSGTVSIPSADTVNPTVTVSLSGTGVAGSATPEITVTDNTDPEDDLVAAFGNVTEGTTRERTITVTNDGNVGLQIGAVAGLNPVAAPFSIVSDSCSNQTVAATTSCVITVRYSPTATGNASDSLDIPSNDANEASVTVQLTGAGIAQGQGGVGTPKPDGADGGFMAIDPATLALVGLAGLWGWRRRPARS